MYRAPAATDPVIYAARFGAVGDNTQDDAPGINAAIAFVQASPTGKGTVVIQPGEYRLTTEILLDSDDLSLAIQPGATLYQDTYGLSCIQIRADGCTVTGGGRLVNPVAKTEITGGTYNGNPARTRSSGVYMLGANRCTVSNITIEGFVFGVNCYEVEANRLSTWCIGNQIDRVRFEHFDFGINGANQQDLTISNCTGYYADRSQGDALDETDNGPAPHFIYIAGKSTTNLPNQSVTITNCTDYFNGYSSSYKAKNSDGIVFNGCQSQLAVRGFDLDVQNFRVVSPIVRDLLGQIGINCNATCSDGEIVSPLVYIDPTTESRYSSLLTGLTLDDINTAKAFVTEETCANITVRGGKFSHSHTSNEPQVQITGSNIMIIDTEIEERDFNAFPIKIKASAIANRIIRPKVKHNATQALTGASWSGGTATFTTAVDTGLAESSYAVVSGVSPGGYNGTHVATSGTTGTSFLAAIVDDPGSYVSGGTLVGSLSANTRMVDIASGAKSTVVEVDPLLLNFTYADSSVSDAGTGTILRRVDGTVSGAWTPAASFDTPGDLTLGSVTADGWYHKHGEWVDIGFILIFTPTFTTASGDFIITGLPFQAITPSSGGWTFVNGVGQFRNIGGTIDSMGISVATSDTLTAKLRRSETGAAGANIAAGSFTSGVESRVQAQITYKIA